MNSTSVNLIFDEKFGEKIKELFIKNHVWIIDSPGNKKIVDFLWKLKKDSPLKFTNQITIFTFNDLEDYESILVTVDEHHNEYSQIPPYNELNIYGLDEINESYLMNLGFKKLEKTNFGFTAKKQ